MYILYILTLYCYPDFVFRYSYHEDQCCTNELDIIYTSRKVVRVPNTVRINPKFFGRSLMFSVILKY